MSAFGAGSALTPLAQRATGLAANENGQAATRMRNWTTPETGARPRKRGTERQTTGSTVHGTNLGAAEHHEASGKENEVPACADASTPGQPSSSSTQGVTPSRLDRINQLRDELTCSICLDICTRPVTTPCGHSFCRGCLRKSLQHSQRCPKCREQMPASAPVTPPEVLAAEQRTGTQQEIDLNSQGMNTTTSLNRSQLPPALLNPFRPPWQQAAGAAGGRGRQGPASRPRQSMLPVAWQVAPRSHALPQHRAAFNPFSEAATQRDPGQSPVTTAAHAAATNGAVRGLAASQASGAGVAPRSGQATAFEALRRARAAMASSVVRDSSHHHAALPPQPSQVQAQEPAPPSQLSQPTASFNPFARQRPVAGSSSQGAQGRSTASLPGTSAPLNPVPAPAASRGGRLTTNPLHSSAGDGRAGSSARVHVQPFGARAAQPVDVIEVLDEDQGSEDHPGQSIPAAAEQSSDDDSGLIIVDDGDEDDGDSEADEEQEASGTDDLEGGSDGEGVSEEEVDADDGLLGMPVPVAANNPDITPLRQLGPQTWLPPVPTDGFVSASELHHLLEHNLQQQQPQQQEAEAEAGHSEGDDDEGVAAMLMSPLAAWGAGAPQEAAVGPRAQPRYTEHRPASLSLQSHPPHITSRHSTGSPGEGVQQAGGRQRGVSRLGSPAHPGGAAVPEHYRVPRDASDRGTDQDEGAGPSSARRRNSRRVTGRQSRRTTADSDTHTPLLRDQTHRPLRLSVPRSPAAMSIVEATPQPPSAVMATPEGNTPTPSPAGYASLEAAFAAAELASPGVQAYTPRVFMRGASVGGDDQQEQGAAGEGGEWGGDSPTSLDYYIASPFYDPGLVGRSAADQDAEEGEMSGQLPPSSPTITTVVADLSLLLAAPPVAPSNDTVTAAHAIARSDAAEVCPGVGQGVRLPRVAVERSPSVLAVSSDEDVEDDRLWPAGAGSRDQNGANQHSKRPGKTFHRGGLLHQRLARLHLAQQQVPGQDATSAAGAGIEAEHAGSLVAGAGAASLPGATAAAIETQAGGGGPANRSMINAMQRPVASASGPSSVRGNVRAVPTAPAAPVGEAGSADRPIELLSSSDDEDDGETGDHGAGLAVSRGRSASATHGSLIQVLAEGRQARSNQGASGASAAVSAAAATAAPGRRMTRSQASQQQQRPVAMPHQGGSTTGSGAEAGAGQRTAWVVPGLRRPSTRR